MTDLELTTDAIIPSNTSIDVTVYEDTDSDGTAENSATQSIGGGTNTYTLTGFDWSSGNDVWIKVEPSNSDVTATALLISATVKQLPLSAPSNLSASATNDDIDLSWKDNSSNEDGFYIYRATSSGSSTADYTQIDSVGSNTTTYTDSALNDGEKYFYRVSAYNTSGESDLSNETSATTALPAPSSLSLDTSIEDEITVSWTDNSNNEDGFEIFRSTDGTNFSSVTTVGANTTSYTDSGLNDGEKYWYYVESYTEHTSSASSTVSGVTVLPAPSSLATDTSIEDEITVSWTDNSNNEDGFEIYRSTDNTNFTSIKTVTANTTSYTDSGLADGEEYWYYVESYTEHTASASNSVSGVTVLPAATSLNADTSVEGEITVTWTDNSNNEDGYRVYQSTDGTNYTQLADIAANSTSYTDSGLLDGEKYWYYVEVYTEHTTTDSSSVSGITILPQPSGVSASVVSNDQIDVSWTDEINNGEYHIQMSRDGISWEWPAGGPSNAGNNTTNANYNPASDTPYERQVGIDSRFKFRVRSSTSHTTSGWVYSGNVYTDPIPPHNPSVSRPDANTFTFTATMKSDIAEGTRIEFREDTGSGYGSWRKFDYVSQASETDGGTDPTVKGNTWSKTMETGTTYHYNNSLSEDSRYQFRLTNPKSGVWKYSKEIYADYGNPGNVYFEDDFESNDLSAWDSVEADAFTTSGSALDSGFSSADQGTYYARLDASGRIEKNLGDLSGESDVIVKCAMAAGSMDASSEYADLEWYDGSSWQNLRTLGHEYNKQGWVEVTALVDSSWLSTDNRIAFEQEGGGGDYTYVDRVVVSNILHEYTSPPAPSGLSLDTSVEDEITASWNVNATFVNAGVDASTNTRARIPVPSENTYSSWEYTSPPYTFTGLNDGEEYKSRANNYIWQPRHGNAMSTLFMVNGTSGDVLATTILPSATSLSTTLVDPDTIDLTWTDNADNEDGFEVYYRPSGGTWTQYSSLSANTTAETLNLSQETTYDFRVDTYTEHTTTQSATTTDSTATLVTTSTTSYASPMYASAVNDRTSLELLDFDLTFDDSKLVWYTDWFSETKVLDEQHDLAIQSAVAAEADDTVARIYVEYDGNGNGVVDYRSDPIDVNSKQLVHDVSGVPIDEGGYYRLRISDYGGYNAIRNINFGIIH